MAWERSNQYYEDSNILNSPQFFNVGMHQYPDMQEELTKSSQRIRAALFPETMGEGYKENVIDPTSAVQHLAKPSQMLKLAVIDLVNYQDDVDVVMRAIPVFIPLLNNNDPSIVKHAAVVMDQLTRINVCTRVMAESVQLIAAILYAIDTTHDPEVMTNLMGALARISNVYNGLLNIFGCRAIPLLVKLLGTSIEKVLFYAKYTLHQLLLYEEGSKQEVKQCLQKMARKN